MMGDTSFSHMQRKLSRRLQKKKGVAQQHTVNYEDDLNSSMKKLNATEREEEQLELSSVGSSTNS